MERLKFKLIVFVIWAVLFFILSLPCVSYSQSGFIYIYDNSAIKTSSDIDSSYYYAENTIRPALDRWLDYYTDFSTSSGETLTVDQLSKYDGIIIAPFMDSLATKPNYTGLPDWLEDNISEAVNDSGVGLFNCDPYIWGYTDNFKNILNVYYPANRFAINSVTNIPYIRDSSHLSDFVNALGYEGEEFYMFDIDSVAERYIKIDSLGNNLKAMIRRGVSPFYPIIAAGQSPSGKAHIWSLLSPPDWWSSPLDSTANGWARQGTMSDLFWRGLVYVAKGGAVIKALDNYASFDWLDNPPSDVSSYEYIRYSLCKSFLNRNIPLDFRIFLYDLGPDDIDYLRYLQGDYGSRLILYGGKGGLGKGFWANKVDTIQGEGYYRSLTADEFHQRVDSMGTISSESGLSFEPIFSAYEDVWDFGAAADSFPIGNWLKKSGMDKTAFSYHPLYTIGSDSMSVNAYRDSALASWYPRPFGSKYWFEDYLNPDGQTMFSYLPTNSSIFSKGYDWMSWEVGDSLLDQALANFKMRMSAALEGGLPAVMEFYPSEAAAICTTGVVPISDTLFTITTRWDSLLSLIKSYADSKHIKWIHSGDALRMVDNLSRYEITSYRRNGNTFNIALAGSTYAETEFLLFYGEGDYKTRIPITVPPFYGSIFLTIKVNVGREGYYVEIY